MARSCSICSRSDAGAINALLGEGRSARSVAVERGLSEDAVQRHAHRHVVAQRMAPPPARRRARLETADDPLDELVAALRVRALAGSPSDTREYRLSLAAQADGRHATPSVRDLASEPEWIALRTSMLAALEPFPEARQAVADALGAP
jgi:hypothetical protein